MLAERRWSHGFGSDVSVVLVGLGNDDLVNGHLGAASAHALVHVVVLLIARHAWLAICEIGKHIRALLKNLLAGLLIIVVIHGTRLFVCLYTIVRQRSYASSNRRFNMSHRNMVVRMIRRIDVIRPDKNILESLPSQAEFIWGPVRPI